ncbi:hypothetical protein [Lysinibacillus sp. LZ02]|uniref:hypothetical protein n=1 Tax=Lysinibacillus sp. LZ02 TaxID=3420668 RepID=UPI003D364584
MNKQKTCICSNCICHRLDVDNIFSDSSNALKAVQQVFKEYKQVETVIVNPDSWMGRELLWQSRKMIDLEKQILDLTRSIKKD